MGIFVNLVGQRFGRLLVEGRTENDKRNKARFVCRCECGQCRIVSGAELKSGDTKSCGCLSKEVSGARFRTHGQTLSSPEYRVWQGMKARCYYTKHKSYSDYGAKGILVCDRWKYSFANFLADMRPRPTSHHTIDRINSEGNYEPENCEWATRLRQNNNKKNIRMVDWLGRRVSIRDLCRIKNVSLAPTVVIWRVDQGWSLEEAISTPRHTKLKCYRSAPTREAALTNELVDAAEAISNLQPAE